MIKNWLFRIFVIGLLLLQAACTPIEKTPAAPLQIAPLDLFAGEAQKFKPFLGLMSGAVQVKYRGEGDVLRIDLEVWEDGKLSHSLGSSDYMLKQQEGDNQFDGEAIFSVQSLPDQAQPANKTSYQVTTALTSESGFTSTKLEWTVDAKQVASSTIELKEEKALQEGERVAVWGMQATDENAIHVVELTPESLQQTKWALIVFLSVTNNE